MRKSLLAVAAGALLVVTPAFAANGNGNHPNPNASNTAALLNKANVMNQEEIHAGHMLASKAGNNIALKTLAQTLIDDHSVNDHAVHELASRDNINLEQYNNNKSSSLNDLNSLHGTAFDKQFLSMEAQDHQQALQEFKAAQKEPQSPAMEMYLGETIPVLRAHLEMIQNVQRDMALNGNTAANMANTDNGVNTAGNTGQ
jgi:putative membrane protein